MRYNVAKLFDTCSLAKKKKKTNEIQQPRGEKTRGCK